MPAEGHFVPAAAAAGKGTGKKRGVESTHTGLRAGIGEQAPAGASVFMHLRSTTIQATVSNAHVQPGSAVLSHLASRPSTRVDQSRPTANSVWWSHTCLIGWIGADVGGMERVGGNGRAES